MRHAPIISNEVSRHGTCSVCRQEAVTIALGDETDEWTPSWCCVGCLEQALKVLREVRGFIDERLSND